MHITFKENLNFATVVGKIRALSARLFTPSDWERLLTAKTTSDLIRLISETPYGRIVSSDDNFDSLLSKLTHSFLLEMDEIEKICPENYFLFYFRYKIDLGNIKRVLYGILSKKQVHLYSGGLISLELFERFLNMGDIELLKTLPYPWDILREVEDEPVLWTYYLEQMYFEGLLELSETYNYNLLKFLIINQIDLENLKMAFRIKTVNYPQGYKKFLYKGGSIDIEQYVKLLDVPFEEWKNSDLLETLGLLEYLDNPIALEKVIDEKLMDILSVSKYTAFGYEPILDYLFRKEIEHRNILFLFSALESHLPTYILRSGIRGL